MSIIWASAPPPEAPGDVQIETTGAPIARGHSARIEDGVAIATPRTPAPDPASALIAEDP
jgi:hypothetical protein